MSSLKNEFPTCPTEINIQQITKNTEQGQRKTKCLASIWTILFSLQFLPPQQMRMQSKSPNSIKLLHSTDPLLSKVKSRIRQFRPLSGSCLLQRLINIHCKCLQGFTGLLQGNQAAGISNLQGLWVTSKPCKTFSRKAIISVGTMLLQGYCGDLSTIFIGYPHNIPVATNSLHLLLFFLTLFYRVCLLSPIPVNLKSLHPDFPIRTL